MSLEASSESGIKDLYLAQIPEQYRAGIQDHEEFQALVQELSNNPLLMELYSETLLRGQQQLLIQKTQAQLRELENMYFEPTSFSPSHILCFFRHCTRNTDRKVHLKFFEDFVDSMVVIKGGTKDFDPAKGEFFSSDTKGCPNGVGGGYDTTVLAHRYTYASFDKISHPQAIGATQVSVIDDENLQGRADVLTMDVADLFITAKKFNRSNIELLMKNMFDFEGGKKILALYLAFIFRTVEEAKEFLQNNCGRMKADSWYKDPAYVARETQSIAPELSTMVDSSGKPMRDLSFDSQGWLDSDGKPTATMSPSMRRLFEIQEKMIDVFQKTGIVPPLELEVRIPGKAKVKKNGTYVDWLSHHKSAGI